MRPRLAYFLPLLILPLPAHPGAEGVGTTSANFLKIAVNARPAAMGEAYYGLSDDEAALAYNPAGMAGMLQNELSATHIEWFQGLRLEHLGGAFSLFGAGVAGLSLTWLQVDDLTKTERNNPGASDPSQQFQELGSFSPHDMALTAAYSLPLTSKWLAGASLRMLQQDIDSNQGYGASLDLGCVYLGVIDHLNMSVVLRDLGTPIDVGGTPAGLPLSLGMGALYAAMNDRLNFTLDTNLPADNKMQSGLGAEGWLYDILALRAGFRFGYLTGFTAGLGLRMSMLKIDYAYVPYGELGYTHRITAGLLFGSPPVSLKADPALFAPKGRESLKSVRLIPKASRADRIRAWKIEIRGSSGFSARTLSGSGPIPSEIPWDGKDDQGALLPDGGYQARLSAEFPGSSSESGPADTEIDNTPPFINLDVSPKAIRPDNQTGAILIPAHFKPKATDIHGVGSWAFEIRDDNDQLFRTFSGQGEPPAEVIWDGSDGKGNYVDTGKIYATQMKAEDSLGNWSLGAPVLQEVMFREIHLSISDKVLFERGKAELKPYSGPELETLALHIKKFCSMEGVHADIIGHTDSNPIHTAEFKNNIELSKARAQAIVNMIVKYYEVDPKLIKAFGKGETEPIATNATDEGRALNRRVEVIIHATDYQ